MNVAYDKHYQTENLFGEPYLELVDFFDKYPNKGKVLDLGCGQGRDAIALARLGYAVTGVDNSSVGIEQMTKLGTKENLNLKGVVADIYAFNQFDEFDFILLDSMFHFAKKDKERETSLIKNIISSMNPGRFMVVCIQDKGKKVEILNQSIDFEKTQPRLVDQQFNYSFKDDKSGLAVDTKYRMIVVEKTV